MKEIKLTQGKVAFVDDEDYEMLVNYGKWHALRYNKAYYATTNINVIKPDGSNGRKLIKMHRLLTNATNPKIYVDHRDRNGLNNQKSNLRLVSNLSENAVNRTKRTGTTSIYTGVYWLSSRKRWTVQVRYKGVTYKKSGFKNEDDAALHYNDIASSIYGSFVNLNILKQKTPDISAEG